MVEILKQKLRKWTVYLNAVIAGKQGTTHFSFARNNFSPWPKKLHWNRKCLPIQIFVQQSSEFTAKLFGRIICGKIVWMTSFRAAHNKSIGFDPSWSFLTPWLAIFEVGFLIIVIFVLHILGFIIYTKFWTIFNLFTLLVWL